VVVLLLVLRGVAVSQFISSSESLPSSLSGSIRVSFLGSLLLGNDS
jgi:hypothetical protein